MRIDLQIGGYAIRLDEPEGHACLSWPLSPFESFQGDSDTPPDFDLEVTVVRRLPDVPHGALIFDSCHGLWKLYAAGSGYVLETNDTRTLEPRSRAALSGDFSRAKVSILGRDAGRTGRLGWEPMQIINPILEVVLVTRLGREGGLFLHASGVLTEEGVWVFTGPSGAGKTTISELFAARGACVLSDERIILRKAAGELLGCGTPWPGTGRQARNQQGPLRGLCCIRHGEDAHALRNLPAREVALFVLRQCFLPHWDRDAMAGTLAFLGDLIERVECFDLSFVRNPDIVDYLATATRHPLVPS